MWLVLGYLILPLMYYGVMENLASSVGELAIVVRVVGLSTLWILVYPPVISTALFERFNSRRLGEFANRVLNGMDTCSGDIMFANVLTWIAIPFVLSTIYFGLRKGENNYYETDKYDGNGTAH